MRINTMIKGLAAAALLASAGPVFATEPQAAAKDSARVVTLASQLKTTLHARCALVADAPPSPEAMMETIAQLSAGQDVAVIEAALANVADDASLCANAKAAASTANELARMARARGAAEAEEGDGTPPILSDRGAPPPAAFYIVGVPGGAGGPSYQNHQ